VFPDKSSKTQQEGERRGEERRGEERRGEEMDCSPETLFLKIYTV
jgi:hypothetical protein